MKTNVKRELFLKELLEVIEYSFTSPNKHRCLTMFNSKMLTWAFDYIRKTMLELNQEKLLTEDIKDAKQEIYVHFFRAEKEFDSTPGRSSFKTYATKRVVWAIRDWLIRSSHIVTTYPYYYFIEEKPEFIIDLNFLVYGTKIYPFNTLSSYERYLIFLHFKEEKTILEISYMVQHSRPHVRMRLNNALNKLRRLSNETKNTARFGTTTNRIRT